MLAAQLANIQAQFLTGRPIVAREDRQLVQRPPLCLRPLGRAQDGPAGRSDRPAPPDRLHRRSGSLAPGPSCRSPAPSGCGSPDHPAVFVNRKQRLHWFIRLLLDRLDNREYDRLVGSIALAVQRFLGRYNRDEMAGASWKLPLYQPRLVMLGLRLLLRRAGRRSRLPSETVAALETE